MARYINAEKLEKDGWSASRTYPQDAHTMVYETKKMTDFPTADVVERKKGKWLESNESISRPYMCSNCGCLYDVDTIMGKLCWNFCPNCGAEMESK